MMLPRLGTVLFLAALFALCTGLVGIPMAALLGSDEFSAFVVGLFVAGSLLLLASCVIQAREA